MDGLELIIVDKVEVCEGGWGTLIGTVRSDFLHY